MKRTLWLLPVFAFACGGRADVAPSDATITNDVAMDSATAAPDTADPWTSGDDGSVDFGSDADATLDEGPFDPYPDVWRVDGGSCDGALEAGPGMLAGCCAGSPCAGDCVRTKGLPDAQPYCYCFDITGGCPASTGFVCCGYKAGCVPAVACVHNYP